MSDRKFKFGDRVITGAGTMSIYIAPDSEFPDMHCVQRLDDQSVARVSHVDLAPRTIKQWMCNWVRGDEFVVLREDSSPQGLGWQRIGEPHSMTVEVPL